MSSIEKAIEKQGSKLKVSVSSRPVTPKDKESTSDVPHDPVTSRPSLPTDKAGNGVNLNLSKLIEKGLLVPGHANLFLAEELRAIKRSILQEIFDQPASEEKGISNIIVVTSAVPGEGKTFISANLALSIAEELDHTVLLVDADFHKAGVTNLFEIDRNPGLTSFLINNKLNVSEIIKKTNIPKLSVIGPGNPSIKSSELLASGAMQALLSEIGERYSNRIIIVDSPPLLASNDARILAGYADQIVMVIEAEKTSRTQVNEALDQVDIQSKNKVKLLLNKRSSISKGKTYYYGYIQNEG